MRSPVPQEVQTELERVVERWRQLPLDHALSHVEEVRVLVQSLADAVAASTGLPPSAVPDCGPATLMDQLTVMVFDVATTSVTSAETATPATTATTNLTQDLVTAQLRRS